ncbi:MAG: putative Ig domain-containing protein [Sphingobacteriales bacterium]
MRRLATRILFFITTSILVSSFEKSSAQAPNILYTPSSASLTAGIPMTSMTPNNSGGAVTSLSYGTGTSITGGGLSLPYGAVTDAAGNVYIVNEATSKGQGSVSKYNVTTHTWSTFQSYTQNTGIKNPAAIAIDASGNIYVLNYNSQDNGNQKSKSGYVTEYTSAGVLIGANTGIVSGLGAATGIAINNTNGNLDIAEESANSGNDQVEEYTTTGGLNFTLTDTHIPNPVNVATDNAGNIYVLDNTNKDVVKFTSTGTYLSIPVSTGLTSPFGLYVDGSGNIYVSDSGVTGTNSIKVYNASGTLLATLTGLTDPEGITTDPSGNLYVTDHTNNTLTEYKPTGGYYISGKLPQGLIFDYTTGTISGTPVAAFSSTTYTITAYNGSGSSNTTVTLSCVANPTLPTIFYDPSVNVYTLGNTITTLTPHVTNSPTSYSISGTLPAGISFSTSTGVISGKPTGSTPQSATLYTITATNGAGSATTTVSIATVIADYWTGATNSDWNTGGNWSTGKVPTSTDYASIGEIAYAKHGSEPTISAAETPVVGYLALGATHTPTLTVSGSLTVNNIFDTDDNSAPILAGTGNVIMPVASVVQVLGTGILTINTGLTVTLQSSVSGSASVDAITGGGSIVGKVSVQRYMSAQRGYRLMASPVNYNGVADANSNLPYSLNYVQSSAYITGTTLAPGGFDVNTTPATTSENPTLYLYREDVKVSNASFISGNNRGISNLTTAPTYSLNNEGSAYTIPASNGFLFFFRGNRTSGSFAQETVTNFAATSATLTATGYLNQGQIVFRDWYSPASASPAYSNSNVAALGFNLVANPYACTIDLDSYNTSSPNIGIYASNVDNVVYELNPQTQNYDTYQAGSAGAIFTNNGSRYIVSGQGFFVHALGTGGGLIFNESAKVPLKQLTSSNLFMSLKAPLTAKAAAAKPLQMLRLEMALDTISKDDILVMFDSDAKPGYVFNEDALYRTGSGKVSLGSISDDKQTLAINKLPLSNGVTIPLKVAASAYATYKLNLKDIKGVPQLFDVWLKDAFTKDSVNMRTNPSYTFSITTDTGSYGAHRFAITMRENPAYTYQLLTFNAAKLSDAKAVQATWQTQYEGDYTSFTVERSIDNGKTFDGISDLNAANQGTYNFVDAHPVNGINLYRLKQQDFNGNITYSKVIPVAYSNTVTNLVNNLNIFPNPATSNINLAVMNDANNKGNYNIIITSSLGFVVKKAATSQPNWQASVSDLLPGTYLVKVFNSKDQSLVGSTKFVKL